MTFVKRNIASYPYASLFDTATLEKGDSQRDAKWPIVEYQSLVLISFFRLSIGSRSRTCLTISLVFLFLFHFIHSFHESFILFQFTLPSYPGPFEWSQRDGEDKYGQVCKSRFLITSLSLGGLRKGFFV